MYSFPAPPPPRNASSSEIPESPNTVLVGSDAINTPGAVLVGVNEYGKAVAVTAERREEQLESMATRAREDLNATHAEYHDAIAGLEGGPQLMPRFCTHCGSRTPNLPARFCASCGSAIGATVPFGTPRAPDLRSAAERSADAAAAAQVQQVPMSEVPLDSPLYHMPVVERQRPRSGFASNAVSAPRYRYGLAKQSAWSGHAIHGESEVHTTVREAAQQQFERDVASGKRVSSPPRPNGGCNGGGGGSPGGGGGAAASGGGDGGGAGRRGFISYPPTAGFVNGGVGGGLGESARDGGAVGGADRHHKASGHARINAAMGAMRAARGKPPARGGGSSNPRTLAEATARGLAEGGGPAAAIDAAALSNWWAGHWGRLSEPLDAALDTAASARHEAFKANDDVFKELEMAFGEKHKWLLPRDPATTVARQLVVKATRATARMRAATEKLELEAETHRIGAQEMVKDVERVLLLGQSECRAQTACIAVEVERAEMSLADARNSLQREGAEVRRLADERVAALQAVVDETKAQATRDVQAAREEFEKQKHLLVGQTQGSRAPGRGDDWDALPRKQSQRAYYARERGGGARHGRSCTTPLHALIRPLLYPAFPRLHLLLAVKLTCMPCVCSCHLVCVQMNSSVRSRRLRSSSEATQESWQALRHRTRRRSRRCASSSSSRLISSTSRCGRRASC